MYRLQRFDFEVFVSYSFKNLNYTDCNFSRFEPIVLLYEQLIIFSFSCKFIFDKFMVLLKVKVIVLFTSFPN